MLNLRRVVKVLLCLALCIPAQAQAAPQFTLLGKNQAAPFKGALFNPEAIAEVLAKKPVHGRAVSVESLAMNLRRKSWNIHWRLTHSTYALNLSAKNTRLLSPRKTKRFTTYTS